MISYYKLKKNEDLFNTILFAFLVLIFSIFWSGAIYILIIFLYLYILLLTSPRFFRILSGALSSAVIFTMSILLIISWLLKVNLPIIGNIDNNQMLIFVTIFYVFLTYKVMKSNFLIFKYQRMPQLLVDVKTDLNLISTFNIKNIGDFPATDLLTTFEIVCPIPKNINSIVKLWFTRIYDKIKFLISNDKKLDYIIVYFSEYLDPNDSISLNIDEEIHKLIDNKAINQEKGLTLIGEKFQVILKYEYKSQDNVYLEVPFYKLFEYQITPTGIQLIRKSGNPIKLI